MLVFSWTTHLMGRFLKALVMTLLIMEITTIVDLTAVWTLLAELHVPQTFVNIALAISVVGLVVLTAFVFRRAMRAERRLESGLETSDWEDVSLTVSQAVMPVNATAPGQPRPVLPAHLSPSSRHAH
ncbi:MAG: hypothetical protein V7651_07900 [Hyphomonas oceanitis]|uniref:hypothetical protein n=1 Tax=Hyphomonas oceanitis TaxID=81033 RepID=UPI003000FE79